MGTKKLSVLIVQKQQDQSSLRALSDPLEANESVALFLPLAKLLAALELDYNELEKVPFKKISKLDRSFQALKAQFVPSEED